MPLWRGDHVAIKQLVDDFGRYLYLPRLKEAAVLLGAVRDGCALLTWEQDAFAYAESYDEAAQRYRGLRGGQHIAVTDGDTGLLVRPEVARRQINAETPTPQLWWRGHWHGHTARTGADAAAPAWSCRAAQTQALSRHGHPRSDACRA